MPVKSISVTALLKRAKGHIKAGEHRLRQAAEDIAKVNATGMTQREIAKAVGKSLGWVNGLLQWRDAGFPDTPFGPDSKAKRERAANVQAPEHKDKEVVITPKMAKEYTNLIVKRKLYEGACELAWPQYFKYRDMHPGKCALLSNADLAYVGQWTSAAPPPQQPPPQQPPHKVPDTTTHTGGTIRTIPDTTTYKPLNLNASKDVHDANADNEKKASLLKQLSDRLLESDDWSNAIRIAGQSTVDGIINGLQRHLNRYIAGGTGTDQAKEVPPNKLN
jgi:hypothetical protein